MTPESLLDDVARDGIGFDLSPEGNIKLHGPRGKVAQWAPLIREHKAALLATLKAANQPKAAKMAKVSSSGALDTFKPDPLALSDADMERRRQDVLRVLQERPEITRAWLADGAADPVRVTLAIRGVGTCELTIPATRWDEWKFLNLLEEHEGTA